MFHHVRLRALRLRVIAGIDLESSVVESCVMDAEDVPVVNLRGPVRNIESTIGT